MTPVIEHLIDLLVIHEFLNENIHLQSLKLWLTQKSMVVLLTIVVGKELSCKVIITGTNFSSIRSIVVP